MSNEILTCPVMLTHPNGPGYTQHCTIQELEHYFARYPGGFLCYFFEGVLHALSSDLTGYMEKACVEYNKAMAPLTEGDMLSQTMLDAEYRTFRHKILEMWRYVKSSMVGLPDFGNYKNVSVLSHNQKDTSIVLMITP